MLAIKLVESIGLGLLSKGASLSKEVEELQEEIVDMRAQVEIGEQRTAQLAEAQGKRPYMEDRALIVDDMGALDARLAGVSFLTVLDGHGGGRCADHAKERLPTRLADALVFEAQLALPRAAPAEARVAEHRVLGCRGSWVSAAALLVNRRGGYQV